MSQCLERMAVGDQLAFKGPRGRLKYTPNMKRALGASRSPLHLVAHIFSTGMWCR